MEIGSPCNDIITEVLSHLPAKSLLKFELVSKLWQNIISDNDFRKLQFQRTKPTISGFFFRASFDGEDQVIYISVNSDHQSSVYHKLLDYLPDKVEPINSSNGLLCCCSCYAKEVREGVNEGVLVEILERISELFIYVCNPAKKEYVQIEWPEYSVHQDFAFVYDPEDMANFKLICVEMVDITSYLFQVYSSKTKEWKKLEVCDYGDEYNGHIGLPLSQVVFASGVLYWMTHGDIIPAFDVEKEQGSVIVLPVQRIFPSEDLCKACIGESEVQLHYIHISEAGLQVWILNCKTTKWVLTHSINLSAMEKEYPQFVYHEAKRAASLVPDRTFDTLSWIEPLVYKDGILLLKLCCSFSYEMQHLETCTKFYTYNFDTRMMKEICTLDKLRFIVDSIGSIGSLVAVPYSMSLVPLRFA